MRKIFLSVTLIFILFCSALMVESQQSGSSNPLSLLKKKRLKEHKDACIGGMVERSAVAVHAWSDTTE